MEALFKAIFHLNNYGLQDPDAGKDWGQEEKGTTKDEMVGWHHWLNGHGFGWTLGVGDGQGSLACCGSWGHRVGHDWATELNWWKLGLNSHIWILQESPSAEVCCIEDESGLCTCVHAKSLQSCPTLCDPMDCSPPGSSVHGILQTKILEWVAITSSWGSSWPRGWTCIP